jgi:hypothetical protein
MPKRINFERLAFAGTAFLAAGPALAHPGHGLPGTAHWHASDAWGLLLVAAVAAALWLARRK